MRHRDDDLSPFREDPVVKALTAPATDAELAHEADALAAYRGAVPVPPQRRRSAARVATGTTVAVLTLAVSGGVAAAYTANLPDSWQQKVYKEFHSIGVPAPDHHKSSTAITTLPTVSSPAPSFAPPTPVHTQKTKPTPSSTPTTKPTATVSPQATSSLPVTVPTAAETASATPTPTPTQTSSDTPEPAAGGQLQIKVDPGSRVPVGTPLTVSGKLTAPNGDPIANRRVALVIRVAGESTRQRYATGVSSAAGEVTITGPKADRNLRLVLRAGHHLRSPVQRVIVVPTLNIQVPSTPRGATAVTVTVTVSGGQPGDVVFVRGPGRRDGRRATLDSSLRASFTVPVSQSQSLHYRATVQRTKAHAAHSLAFYVPPSGG